MSTHRRRARELALQFEFQKEFCEQEDRNTRLNHFRQSFDEPKEIWEYAILLIEGVEKSIDEIDKALNGVANNWSVERMALVDRNILRIAVFEIRVLDVPPNAVINEALEIAKKYGNSESAAFINGLLDEIVKQAH